VAAADCRVGGGPRRAGDGWPRAPRNGAGWPHILLVDDDPAIRRYLARHLPSAGFIVRGIDPDQLDLERLQQLRPDAVIVGIDCTEPDSMFLRVVRQASQAPILALLSSQDSRATIEALDLGACDCLAKPFLLGELAAHMRKTLRQTLTNRMPSHILRAGDLEVDFVRGAVRLRGEDVALTSVEYWVLQRLAEEAGKVVSARSLLADGWATSDMRKANRVSRVVQALRAKLLVRQDGAVNIASEAGRGYRLQLLGLSPLHCDDPVGR